MTASSIGTLIGIATRTARRQPMLTLDHVEVGIDTGLEGDFKGPKYPRRQVTVLSLEAWQAALADLNDLAGPVPLPWTARRANLLVEGIDLPRAKGGIVEIGSVVLEVTGQTYPCVRMEEVHRGLLKALANAWRGGITCRVVAGGNIRIGDHAKVLVAPPEQIVRLPG